MSQKDSVGVALQEDISTPSTTMDYWPPVTAENLDVTRDEMKLDEAFGVRAPADTELGGKSVAGKVEGAVRPTSIGAFLSACFGEPDTTLLSAGVYQHVWDAVGAGMVPLPLSIMSVNGDVTPAIVELYKGCMLNTLELSAATKDYMMMAADFLGLGIDTSQSAPSVTRDGSAKFRWDQLGATLAVDGAAAAPIKISEFGFTYGNGIELDDPAFGETNPTGATPGDVEVGCTFTANETLGAHRTRALLDTPENCRLVLTATGAHIGVTSVHTSLAIDIARLRYTSVPVDISGKEILKNVKVTCRGSLDETLSKLVTITLVNGEDGSKYVAPGVS